MNKFIKILAVAAFALTLFSHASAQYSNTGASIGFGDDLPTTCTPNAKAKVLFWKKTAPIGLYECLTVNSWTKSGGGGGSGLTNLNGLTADPQTFATGTSGTNFNISSSVSTHTFNLPVASATNTGKLSNADWTTFNNKGNAQTANPLSQFASTTSAQLAGVISNETGSGALVFGTSPTIDSPFFSGTITGTYTLGGTPTFPSTVVSTTGTQTLTNKTLTSPVINVGSDATADIYYRNSGGNFARLPVGSNGQVLTVNSGLPSWQNASGGGGLSYTTTGTSGRIPVFDGTGFQDSIIDQDSGEVTFTAPSAAKTPLTVQGAASQTNPLFNLVNNSGTSLTSFLSDGRLEVAGGSMNSSDIAFAIKGANTSGLAFQTGSLRAGVFLAGTKYWEINTDGMQIGSTGQYLFNSQTANNGGNDTGLARRSAGVVMPTNGSTGSGEIFINDSTKGVILKAPNAGCWRITVSNAGALTTTSITCP